MHPRLSLLERLVHWNYYLVYLGICLYELYKLSAEHKQNVGNRYLEEGWILPNSWKDKTDFEWTTITLYLRRAWKWMVAFVLLSRLVELICPSRLWLKAFQLGFSLLWWYSEVERYLFLLFLAINIIFYLTSFSPRPVFVYLVTLVCYIGINVESLVYSLPMHGFWTLFYTGMPFYARNASFALEACTTRCRLTQSVTSTKTKEQGGERVGGTRCDESPSKAHFDPAKRKKDDDYEKEEESSRKMRTSHEQRTVKDATRKGLRGERLTEDDAQLGEGDLSFLSQMHYVYYFPLMFTGPMMTFNAFHSQYRKDSRGWDAKRLGSHFVGVGRVVMWVMLNELILEVMHFYILNEQPGVLQTLSLQLLLAVGYMLGQFFMNKYVVIFGTGRELAKFDGLQPPTGPKCISYIYRYTRMWKCFDNGLYLFLKRYIFLPLGGSQTGLLRRMLSSALCFSFIVLWHGNDRHTVTWVALNFAEALLEMLGDVLSKTQLVRSLEAKLSPQCVRRLHAIFCIPLLFMSWISIFFFFGYSQETGMVYVSKIALTSTWMELGLFVLFLYAFIQSSMDVENYLQSK